MRVLVWHAWSLEGSGSNVYTASIAASLRGRGHDVILLCQEPRPDAFPFVDAWGSVGADGISPLVSTGAAPAHGTVTLLRPGIGSVLPVFVIDEYRGPDVRPFTELTESELDVYLTRNVEALRAVVSLHDVDAVVAGHAVPGSVVAHRALGPRRYVSTVHGSDLYYVVSEQDRYRRLAAEGLAGSRWVAVPSDDTARRTTHLVPEVEASVRTVRPGVEAPLFHAASRQEVLSHVADTIERDHHRKPNRIGSDAGTRSLLDQWYDPTAPDPSDLARLRELAMFPGPLVGYLGRLFPGKGADRLIQALSLCPPDVQALVMGSGDDRERIAAIADAAGLTRRVTFTGHLPHRLAGSALAALDVLVVPSILPEAFGMVAAEAAAAHAFPLVARHSGLAEIAGALEAVAGHAGLFSYEPGDDAPRRIAAGVERLLGLSRGEQGRIREAIRTFVTDRWTWEATVDCLLGSEGD